LREQDYLARYGGEEFCVIITGLPASRAAEVIGRMLRVTPDNQTFSAGVASWNGKESPDCLVARADGALYDAKRSGRNRVTVAGDERDPATAPGRELEPVVTGG
jgi:diguanylate cyclase (GGDEF)-like protein